MGRNAADFLASEASQKQTCFEFLWHHKWIRLEHLHIPSGYWRAFALACQRAACLSGMLLDTSSASPPPCALLHKDTVALTPCLRMGCQLSLHFFSSGEACLWSVSPFTQETMFLRDVLIVCLMLSIVAAARKRSCVSCSVLALLHRSCLEDSLLFRLALLSSGLGHYTKYSQNFYRTPSNYMWVFIPVSSGC